MQIGLKIDNCSTKSNKKYWKRLKDISKFTNLEVGIECYGKKRTCELNSKLLEKIFKEFKRRKEDTPELKNIVHLSLEAKVLNKENFTEEEWIEKWTKQAEILNPLYVDYVVVHATSNESKVIPEDEQIEIIHRNFKVLSEIIPVPIYVENTYEDLYFYEKLFKNAPLDMNFVCDIGHLKIHSPNQSQMEWTLFLKRLAFQGRGIHFHIHDNNGIQDQHNPISTDNNKKIITFVQKLLAYFPSSVFVLEQHSTSIEDMFKDYLLLKG